MTDHPRFQSPTGGPDQCYRQYHGAVLVTGAIGAADWWLNFRSREGSAACASVPEPNPSIDPSLVEDAP